MSFESQIYDSRFTEMKRIPDLLSFCRIIGSVGLIFCPTFGLRFYLVYLFCGISDMADGFWARKYRCETKHGARIDSIADLIFFGAVGVKTVTEVIVPIWLWAGIGAVLILKLLGVSVGIVRYRCLVLPHTVANKVTGAAVFCLPFFMWHNGWQYAAIPICLLAVFAAAEEGYGLLTGKYGN